LRAGRDDTAADPWRQELSHVSKVLGVSRP
jgi:hypothetical protein